MEEFITSDIKICEKIKTKRHRKKTNYKKINNQTRQKLIEMVYLNDYLLKDAAKILGINYSTAKTILRIFRIEKRIEKKNADEERKLKELIFDFKKSKNVGTGCAEEENKDSRKNEKSDYQEEKGRFLTDLKNEFESFNRKLTELDAYYQLCSSQINKNQMMISIIFDTMFQIRRPVQSHITDQQAYNHFMPSYKNNSTSPANGAPFIMSERSLNLDEFNSKEYIRNLKN